MPELDSKNITNIVVRGTNWVGDAVMTIPALRELRRIFPEATITLASRPWAQGIFAGAEFINDLMIHESTGLGSVVQQVRAWRKREFDLAVLFPNSLESALVASVSRVPIRIGYSSEGRQRLLTAALAMPEWRSSRHEVFYYLNIIQHVEQLVKQTSTVSLDTADASLSVTEERKASARQILRANGVRPDHTVVALCPGSINSRAKRWPADRYAYLADRLIKESDAEVVLIGSDAEVEVANEVRTLMRGAPVMLAGKTDLAQLVAILSVVDLLVTNDTGPAHIASSLGRPTLVVFGPTNPLTTRPFSSVGEIIRKPPDCAPCMLRDCPIDHRCMTAISVDEVFERVNTIMERELATTAGGSRAFSPLASTGKMPVPQA